MIFKRRSSHEVPGLNTAALPDLIFTVLFFFMIVTNIRKADIRVEFIMPDGTEIQKLEHRSTTMYIFVGKDGRIQLNDKLVEIDEIEGYVSEFVERLAPEDMPKLEVALKADKGTPTGTITDIKQELRKAGVQKVHFGGL